MFPFSFKLSSDTPVTFKSENIEKYAELCMTFLKTKKAESIFFQGEFIAFRKGLPVFNTHPFSLIEQPKIYFLDNGNGILKLEYTFALKWFWVFTSLVSILFLIFGPSPLFALLIFVFAGFGNVFICITNQKAILEELKQLTQ